MKPFDLEAAKRGEPIQTRDGQPVKFIAYVPEAYEHIRVIASIGKMVVLYYESGRESERIETAFDLFMATRKRTVWVNLYPEWGVGVYESKEMADKLGDQVEIDRVGNRAWPLEIEE